MTVSPSFASFALLLSAFMPSIVANIPPAPSQPGNLATRQLVSAPLTGVDGPKPEDIRDGEWNSSWFTSSAIALSLTDETFEKLWKDTTEPNGAMAGSGSESADFTLINTLGEDEIHNFKWKEIKDDGKADYNKDDSKWWLAGLQYAYMKMEPNKVMEVGVFPNGHPVSAFGAFTKKQVIPFKNIGEDKNLWELFMKCKSNPIVFETNDQIDSTDGSITAQPNNWYAITEAIYTKADVGIQDPWKRGFVTYYDPKDGKRVEVKFTDLAKNIQQVVSVNMA